MPDTPASRIARLEQRADDFLRRMERHEDDLKAFAGETGARIRIETEMTGEIRNMRDDVKELKDWREEMDELAREKNRFKLTTYISVGALVLTALGIVVGVIGLLH